MTQATPMAALPMYDWPEIASSTDRLWACIRERLRAAGLPAPQSLTRTEPIARLWTAPSMILTQSCGLPYVRGVKRYMQLVGTPDYDLPECAPGYYRSAIVVRADDPRSSLSAFAGAVVAVNADGSQSGFAALAYRLGREAHHAGGFFAAMLKTGSHRASVEAVARRQADLAAIDAVSWRLAQRHAPDAAALRVLEMTDPMPGLPMLTAPSFDPRNVGQAVKEGIDMLPTHDKSALGLVGLCVFSPEDYDIIEKRARVAPPLVGRRN
ncbi:MAG: PhnD/SsuA/transferrin family substrate-binding protein [Pseudomonadota bacterium]